MQKFNMHNIKWIFIIIYLFFDFNFPYFKQLA